MKKSFLMAMGMVCILLLYGYLATKAGHDHNSHSEQSTHKEDNHSH